VKLTIAFKEFIVFHLWLTLEMDCAWLTCDGLEDDRAEGTDEGLLHVGLT
jgi:hypothetical protein